MAATADPVIAKAATKAASFSRKEIKRYRQLQKEKAVRDQRAHDATIRENAIREVTTQAKAEGTREAQLGVARRMIALGLPIDTIAEATQMTPDEIATLA